MNMRILSFKNMLLEIAFRNSIMNKLLMLVHKFRMRFYYNNDRIKHLVTKKQRYIYITKNRILVSKKYIDPISSNLTLHNEAGPAFIAPIIPTTQGLQTNIFYVWYKNGMIHRINGPACIHKDIKTDEVLSQIWYLDDKSLEGCDITEWIEENNIDLSTKEGQLAFVMFWG